ncbi:MAG: methyltransferase domain-containing protein [Saprospiraceae bacterium]
MTAPAINENEIVAYYDNCEVDYTLVWHLKSHLAMHYGYWEPGTGRLRHALNLMNKKLTEYARITKTDEVLDAGCGVGGSSIYLAKNTGCRVQGITLSEKQVQSCLKNAKTHGVEHLTRFDRQNYLSTPFEDQSFDVVWGVESVCYAFDKRDFLREAYRLLRPGGRLVVADFFSVPLQPGTPEEALMDKWTNTWAIKSYAVTEEFRQQAVEEGFQNVVAKDITRQVEPSIRRLYYSFFPGIVITYISQLLGIRNNLQAANTWSTYYQYKAWKMGLWRYNIITAEK